MMNIDFITATVLDGAFAAVAAIGFAIISNPPRKAILISAFLAAVGHGSRYSTAAKYPSGKMQSESNMIRYSPCPRSAP